ncbi:MAG: PAS domain S-box protein, partial [Planctomycetota bacterium]
MLSLFKNGNTAAAAADDRSDYNPSQAVLDGFSRFQAMIEFTPDGTILTANDNFLAATGYTLDEVRGKHHRIFMDPAEAATPEYAEFWASLAAGEGSSREFRRLKKSGEALWINATYAPVLDESGRVVKVVKIAVDVTETKLESQEATRLSNMVENLPTNVIYADRDNIIRYMNPASFKTLERLQHLLPI